MGAVCGGVAPADSCLVGVSAIDDSDVSTVTVAANDITTAAVTPVSDDDMLIVVGSADRWGAGPHLDGNRVDDGTVRGDRPDAALPDC